MSHDAQFIRDHPVVIVDISAQSIFSMCQPQVVGFEYSNGPARDC